MTTGSNIGAFDLRGRRRAELSAGDGGSSPPSPVKLWKLALDAGAKHVWGGEDGALPDIVGGVDLVRGSGQATPSNPALDAFWSGGAQSTNIGANTGAQNVTLNKGADRSWMLACYPTSAPSGTRALLALGAYTDADGLGTLAITAGQVRWLDRNWPSDAGVDLFNPAGHYGELWCFFGKWDATSLTHTLYWRTASGAEGSATRPGVAEGTAACQVWIGGDGSSIWTLEHPYIWTLAALADGHALASEDLRDTCYNALGWEAP